MNEKRFGREYRVEHNSGATLQNVLFPQYIDAIMKSYMGMINKETDGVLILFSSLKAMFPPLQLFLKNYSEIQSSLKECERLKNEWKHYGKGGFPIKLATRLDELYTKFWEAYNKSNAGLSIQSTDPNREREVYNYLTGKPPEKSTT